MKEYFDIKVNFDNTLYYFYEWEENEIEYIKKIPLIKVSKRVFKDIISNKIKIDKDLNECIKNKMVFLNNQKSSGCIISDGDNSLVLEFSKCKEIAISSLDLKTELEISELLYNEKKFDFKYTIIEPRKFNIISKKDNMIKNYLNIWIEELFKSNNKDKINFYYREWFKRKIESNVNAYEEMISDLNNEIKSIHYYIYELSLLEHNKSGLSK